MVYWIAITQVSKSVMYSNGLLRATNDIKQAINEKRVTILGPFDYSMAFDKVKHNILLRKLRGIGCSDSGVRLFTSYLSGRLQTMLDSTRVPSEPQPVTSGVSQRSVL